MPPEPNPAPSPSPQPGAPPPSPAPSPAPNPGAAPATPSPAPNGGESPPSPERPERPPLLAGGGESDDGGGGLDDFEGHREAFNKHWQRLFAGTDEKLLEKRLKKLGRFKSPETFLAAVENLQKAYDAKRASYDPPEGAGEADVAAWRKDMGIPDKPDGYAFEAPKGAQLTEQDKAAWGHFSAAMHAANLPAATAEKLTQAYWAYGAAVQQAQYQAAEELWGQNRDQLVQDWGPARKSRMDAAYRFLLEEFGAEDGKALSEIPLANGLKLGDMAAFSKFLDALHRKYGPERVTIMAEHGSVQSVEKQYRELLALGNSAKDEDRERYRQPETQERLLKLRGQLDRLREQEEART